MTDDVKALVEALKPFADYMQNGMGLNHKGEPLPDNEGVGWVYLTVGDFRRAKAALEALSRDRDRAGEQKVVVVKPLDWNEYEREGAIEEWDAEAGSFGCFYNIRLDHYGYRLTFDHGQFGTFDNLDTAKSAAQADYEKLILSALASPRS